MTKGAEKKIGMFRKISVEMYTDDRFLALTPVQPSGRSLWLHLITGPHTCPIPGLSKAGPASIAEELGWDVEDFREAFGEIMDQGMAKADWDARVLWLPNAIKHNLPQSPNVVQSWAKVWPFIPDCALKLEAWATLREAIKSCDIKGDGFVKAFDKACPKPSGKTAGKGARKVSGIQRAVRREQIEEEDSPPPTPAPVPSATPTPSPKPDPIAASFEDAWEAFPRKRRGDKKQGLTAYRSAFKRYPDLDTTTVLTAILEYAESDEVQRGYPQGFARWFNDAGWTKDYSPPRPGVNGHRNGHGRSASYYTAMQSLHAKLPPQQDDPLDDIDRELFGMTKQ